MITIADAAQLSCLPMDVTPEEFLSKEGSFALTDGEGNASLFQRGVDGLYIGHYYFNIKGRQAVNLACEMLDFFFDKTEEQVLRGLTPLSNLKARWMSRHLGFKGYGSVYDGEELCELFILTKSEWKILNGRS